MVYEILAGIITLVIVLLAFYLIKTLIALQKFLTTSKTSLERIQLEVALMHSEITPLVRGSSELLHKVNMHVEELNPLVKSIHNVGSFLNEATTQGEMHRVPSLGKNKIFWQEAIAEALVLTSMGLKIFQQFQKRR